MTTIENILIYINDLLDCLTKLGHRLCVENEEVVGNISDNNSNNVAYKYDLLSKQRISTESENKYL